MAKRPSSEHRTRGEVPVICPTAQIECFQRSDWTVDSALIGFGKFDLWRNVFSVIPGRCHRVRAAARWIPGLRLTAHPGMTILRVPDATQRATLRRRAGTH